MKAVQLNSTIWSQLERFSPLHSSDTVFYLIDRLYPLFFMSLSSLFCYRSDCLIRFLYPIWLFNTLSVSDMTIQYVLIFNMFTIHVTNYYSQLLLCISVIEMINFYINQKQVSNDSNIDIRIMKQNIESAIFNDWCYSDI